MKYASPTRKVRTHGIPVEVTTAVVTEGGRGAVGAIAKEHGDPIATVLYHVEKKGRRWAVTVDGKFIDNGKGGLTQVGGLTFEVDSIDEVRAIAFRAAVSEAASAFEII